MERKSARKMVTILVFTVMCLTLVSVPTVSAQPNKPLRCEVEMAFDWDSYQWIGTVSGDIEGSITFTPEGATFPGSTEHFFETWVIETDGGDVIKGYHKGVWSFKTFKFRTNGKVTSASGEWSHLVGRKVHSIGTTSPFPAEEITGEGTFQIN
jgi:hypothetical protein